MGRVNGFGLALKAPRKLAGGKPPVPPPETRSRVEPAPAGRRQPGSRCFRRPFRTRRLRPQYRGRRPPRRSCPRLISAVPPGPPKPPPKTEASMPPKTAGNPQFQRFCLFINGLCQFHEVGSAALRLGAGAHRFRSAAHRARWLGNRLCCRPHRCRHRNSSSGCRAHRLSAAPPTTGYRAHQTCALGRIKDHEATDYRTTGPRNHRPRDAA